LDAERGQISAPVHNLVVVNEVETRMLTGVPDPYAAADVLMSWGAGAVVTTLGAEGALMTEPHGARAVSAPAVHAVDTAGAGDVFCGVLAGSLAGGRPLMDAVPLAVAAASLSVTRRGTSSSFPTRVELANIKTVANPQEA
jgi:ribokinase